MLDIAKWGVPEGVDSDIDHLIALNLTYMNRTKDNILKRFKKPWAVPNSQSSYDIIIDDVNGSSVAADQYIRLKNNSSEYIDVSAWHLDGIDYTIPPGTVIASGGTVMLLKNDVAYRGAHGGGIFVGGQYGTDLSTLPDHVLTLKNASGLQIDQREY